MKSALNRVLSLGMNSRVWCLTMAVTLAGVSPAVAQVMVPDIGGRVFGTVGGSFGDGGSTIMTSGGVGLRLTRHLGLDLEVLYVPALDLTNDGLFFIQQGRQFALGFPPPFDMDRDASVTAFLTTFTVEFPIAGGRLFPYLTGGGGVGHLSERVRYRPWGDIPILQVAEPSSLSPLIFPPPAFKSSETGLSLTVGGGIDIRLWRGLGIGVDARWLRLLSSREDLDTAQIASRVSYRF